MESLLDLNLMDMESSSNTEIEIEEFCSGDIAIIGISGAFSEAKDAQQFWENIKNGEDCMKPFPPKRAKAMDVLADGLGIFPEAREYSRGGFLEEIDNFDYGFFGLSPKEASLMDPNQRLFLQTGIKAIEDAGYGGKKLVGRNVGVYAGYSDDFGIDYKTIVSRVDPSLFSMGISGNVKSIIPSRISYIMDFKGPSVVIDTACSSALVAIHMACQAIRNNQCEMALAGAVKINLMPIGGGKGAGIGIESSDGKTRTFDDTSDGTGIGEGVGVIILKPLSKAINDRDSIYAVIKGSAYNQDGASMGITAPNAKAQQEVITKAWTAAGIEPESISYIEAHGTGTKLGDPIEIDGIESAFRKYTNRKQFCAIGSVKTNIGHLDNAAGIAGIIKAAYALKTKKLPPTINFNIPNRNISFESSPVYVNSRLSEWQAKESPRRCGVSSFGLSGTNCHIVMEEGPEIQNNTVNNNGTDSLRILTLSAKSENSLKALINEYRELCKKGFCYSIDDLCYTANTGRGHHNYRVAIIIKNENDLRKKIDEISNTDLNGISIEGLYYGKHRIVPEHKNNRSEGAITEEEIKGLTSEWNKNVEGFVDDSGETIEALELICKLYIAGADVDFDKLYRNAAYRRVNLPTYPFEKKSCWITLENNQIGVNEANDKYLKEINHPLLDSCLAQSLDTQIYYTKFSVDKHWELSEHKVKGNYVAPGTTYLEMIREVYSRHINKNNMELRDIVFIKPMAVNYGETREVQTVIRINDGYYDVYIASRLDSDDLWTKHVEGKIIDLDFDECKSYDIESIKERCVNRSDASHRYKSEGVIDTGERWNTIKEIYLGDEELIAYLELDDRFLEEVNIYGLHPALMDCGVNIEIRSIDEDLYLPFYYKRLKIYGPMPQKFFSYTRRRANESKTKESVSFDISLIDQNGKAFAEVEGYTIKKVKERDLLISGKSGPDYYDLVWKEKKLEGFSSDFRDGSILVIKDQKGFGNRLIDRLRKDGRQVIEVSAGKEYKKICDSKYEVGICEEDYIKLLQDNYRELSYIFHLQSIIDDRGEDGLENLYRKQRNGVDSLFYLVKAINKVVLENELDIFLIGDCGNVVTKNEERINPETAMLFGLGKSIGEENKKVNCRALDIDKDISIEDLLTELKTSNRNYITAYRDGKRFVEIFEEANIEKAKKKEITLDNIGAYLITGGTGGLGLEIAKYLSSKESINLCLVNRSGFIDKKDWNRILTEDKDEKLCNKIRILKEIEEHGSTVNCFSVDITKLEDTKSLIDDIKKEYGKINGIVHCAGIPGDGFIRGKSKETFDEVIRPKVQGTWILDHLTQGDELDFFVMFSSVTSILGGAGQGDYTAANAYMDTFTYQRTAKGKRSLSINWPAWKETGMAVDLNVEDNGPFRAISSEYAIMSFDEMIHREIPRILVSEINYESEALKNEDKMPFELSYKIKNLVNQRRHKKSNGLDRKVASKNVILAGEDKNGSYSETEQLIANIWGRLLEVDEIDVSCSFFEMGGNSLFAIKMELEMEKHGMPIEYSDIENYPTISELAAYVDGDLVQEVKMSLISEEEIVASAEVESDDVVLEGIEPINEVIYKGCFYRAFLPILKYFNRNILRFIVNDVIVYDTDIVSEDKYFTVKYVADKPLQQLCRDISFEIHSKVKSKEIVKDIKEALSKGRPVIISVDCFYESMRNDTYNKIHWPHNLLVYGYNEKEKTFNVLEHKNRGSVIYDKCIISYSDVINSYQGYIENYRNLDIVNSDFNYLTFDDREEYPTYFEIHNSVGKSEIEFKTEMIRDTFISNLLKKDELILGGIEKLNKFTEKFSRIVLKEELLRENGEGLLAILNTIINAKQIEEYRVKHLFPEHSALIDTLGEIVEKWENIRRIIAKYIYSTRYRLRDMNSSIAEINQAYHLEKKFYNEFFEILRRSGQK
ncbi:SDR family NAD(P)-dependent oxidoreductase [Wukongibacter sp. M2B1]|uniref:SDR family NAD(P)-dependent oxidoreductase n=1 Tax=Wukongibacter sp. M2B1 TaxID=3088895 RepID=UPI003D7AE1DC